MVINEVDKVMGIKERKLYGVKDVPTLDVFPISKDSIVIDYANSVTKLTTENGEILLVKSQLRDFSEESLIGQELDIRLKYIAKRLDNYEEEAREELLQGMTLRGTSSEYDATTVSDTVLVFASGGVIVTTFMLYLFGKLKPEE